MASRKEHGIASVTNAGVAGKVKWFNKYKKFGFIKPRNGGKDVFVHISAVEQAGLSTLHEGQEIVYDLVETLSGKTCAENLSVGA